MEILATYINDLGYLVGVVVEGTSYRKVEVLLPSMTEFAFQEGM